MGTVDEIRAKVPAFRGYDDEQSRHDCDELVRGYVGEALAQLNAQHPEYFAKYSDQYGDLLFRCGFANQAAAKPFEHAQLTADQLEAVARNDLAMLELADRAAALQPAETEGYIVELLAAFERRDSTMLASKPG